LVGEICIFTHNVGENAIFTQGGYNCILILLTVID